MRWLLVIRNLSTSISVLDSWIAESIYWSAPFLATAGMTTPYDGIILGAGHNSLVLHAYLARSGLCILALDRATTAGGGLATEENPRLPGFLHNTHSFFHRALTAMPWYRDLDLERQDRKSTRLNSSHIQKSRMPSSA